MIDRRPAVIVRCTGPADVGGCHTLRSGTGAADRGAWWWHNVAGNALCEGGVIVDLSPMRAVRVDASRSVVRVAGGALLGDVDHETQVFGLATPLGAVSETGVGGLSLNGGLGFLTRRLAWQPTTWCPPTW